MFTVTSIPTTIGSEVTLNASAFPGKEDITEQSIILNVKEEEGPITKPITTTSKPTTQLQDVKTTTTKISEDTTTTVIRTTELPKETSEGFSTSTEIPAGEVTKVSSEEVITSVVGVTEGSVVTQSNDIVTQSGDIVTQSGDIVNENVTNFTNVDDITPVLTTVVSKNITFFFIIYFSI